MPAGHFVARLQLAFHRDKDLDHLHDAGRQLVAALQFFDLALKSRGEGRDGILHLLLQTLDIRHPCVITDRDLPPQRRGIFGQHFLGDFGPRLHSPGAADRGLTEQQLLQPRGEAALEDGALVVAVLGQPLDLGPFDRQCALVLVDATPREYPHLDDRARHARRKPQRSVADIGRLFSKNRAKKLLFRSHRRLALRGDLADEDVARFDLGADIDDPGLVEIFQRLLADVRNVARDLFLPELGVARHDLEFFDMDRGKHVVGHDPL